MKHDWQDVSAENGILGPLKRRCTNCGTVQEHQTDYAWMRVTGYRWRPLAGRCRPLQSANIALADESLPELAA